jgi:hypothetical protein
MSIPRIPIRLVKGKCADDHKECRVHLTRVPVSGELVQWSGTTEPCRVLTVVHFDLIPDPQVYPYVAICEVE